jgi:hypothetical protein
MSTIRSPRACVRACVRAQARYEAFLRGQRLQARKTSEMEYQAELNEFKQARLLFRPLSKVMALRFQPASSSDTAG